MKSNFASDNYAGVHPKVFEAMAKAGSGMAAAYGYDSNTAQVDSLFKHHFGNHAHAFLVFNGTGANIVALSCMLEPYQAIICAQTAHINVDECGAPEKLLGSKLLAVPTKNGKLRPTDIAVFLDQLGFEHAVQPRVVAITQATEYGTVYTVQEIREIADFAHQNNMLLFLDGARLSNAAATLGVSLKGMTTDAGVDALTFGGTKNGIMLGEAVIFFDDVLAKKAKFIRKQNLQLASKMRFIAAQFQALFEHDLWLHNAAHANKMAALLAEQIKDLSGVSIAQPIESNSVFVTVGAAIIHELQHKHHFYVWQKNISLVRLMTSFQTTQTEVEALVTDLKRLCS